MIAVDYAARADLFANGAPDGLRTAILVQASGGGQILAATSD